MVTKFIEEEVHYSDFFCSQNICSVLNDFIDLQRFQGAYEGGRVMYFVTFSLAVCKLFERTQSKHTNNGHVIKNWSQTAKDITALDIIQAMLKICCLRLDKQTYTLSQKVIHPATT